MGLYLGLAGVLLLAGGAVAIWWEWWRKPYVTEEQRIEAVRHKRLMEELVASEGWKLLAGFGEAQVAPRRNQVMLAPTKDVMENEFMKGEVQGIELILRTPEKLIEESKAVIEIANSMAEHPTDET